MNVFMVSPKVIVMKFAVELPSGSQLDFETPEALERALGTMRGGTPLVIRDGRLQTSAVGAERRQLASTWNRRALASFLAAEPSPRFCPDRSPGVAHSAGASYVSAPLGGLGGYAGNSAGLRLPPFSFQQTAQAETGGRRPTHHDDDRNEQRRCPA